MNHSSEFEGKYWNTTSGCVHIKLSRNWGSLSRFQHIRRVQRMDAKNLTVPLRVKTLQIVGASLRLLPFIMWFPTSVVMLWGFKEFKKNYFLCLCVCQLVTGP